jgi:predicted DNA-binding transcriptional regulator AlpA
VPDDPSLRTAEDLAEMCRVPLSTVYAWRHTGNGPRALRIGKYLRYRQTDIDEWLESSAVSGTAA